jgi:hypothetical protein
MMAVNKTLGTHEDVRPSEEEEEEEVEKLEADVKEMAQKILEYRAALPDQLRTTLASALSAQRPVLPDGLGPAPLGALNTGHASRLFFVKNFLVRLWLVVCTAVLKKMQKKKKKNDFFSFSFQELRF